VGVDYDAAEKLTSAQLTQRLDTILVAAQRAMRQIPEAHSGSNGRGEIGRFCNWGITSFASR
jgi:hypothetical protein